MMQNGFRVFDWMIKLGLAPSELLIFAFLCENEGRSFTKEEIAAKTGLPTSDVFGACNLNVMGYCEMSLKKHDISSRNDRCEADYIYTVTLKNLHTAMKNANGIFDE